ncbi:CTD kinase subunit gamma CTK3-domain-containing protein [Desarmillaria tabescens]|uniref:CTD kinase subunit gamma CTK3-domain-containing protein n=1 Tax=Armillaria tabescens TaxID=1929756 RepID=A0AA39T757_ARMTA|nr:CTD kinase subunit gamma CTK3-domain-containing protein [Desarmillaria tabescens]KAK0469166.1 CTD kinase subunit gamma CTK3-domain-containing protein [Desarmillaria tabescens]
MDPFEVRIQFLALLRRLNATQQSIHKAVGFAVKYFAPCGEDLWDCIVEECQKGSINSRINTLYFLDSLCEMSLLVKSHAKVVRSNRPESNQYVDYVARDLGKIVEYVVPSGREGLPNLISTRQVGLQPSILNASSSRDYVRLPPLQILESWKSKRVIDPEIIDEALSNLSARENNPGESNSTHRAHLPRQEIFKRIEEDRERHKRLRERRWVQPISHNPSTQQLTSFMPFTEKGDGEFELSLDIEFENEWDTVSDWNEDDEEACAEENALCFPSPNSSIV